ncbi:MAG: sulfatase-like hydrolase/transferase, partial [Phycisphaerales bacterium]|nr:sulfatase-like hydrolase/transferase [Phycisphaerales bacterium]
MQKKPHIIIFNPDQFRADCLGHMGCVAAKTPIMDRLAREEAVSFRWAFCQNPICTPSRCSFMTGWYPHTRGHRSLFHMLHSEAGETNLLKVLKENGYHVWWGGKNDLVPGQNGYTEQCDV